MKLFWIVSVLTLAGCISSRSPEQNLPAHMTAVPDLRPDEQMLSEEQVLRKRRQENSLDYEDKNPASLNSFYTVEEITNGCLRFHKGHGADREDIVPIFLPDLCKTAYKYVIHPTITCQSKGAVQFPITKRGITVHWRLKGVKGFAKTDPYGRLRIVIMSPSPLAIEREISLSLDQQWEKTLPNSAKITLSDDDC